VIEIILPVGIIAALIMLNGLFVAAEFAIVAAPVTRIAQRAEEGSRVARRVLEVLRDRSRQNRYLATAQIGITLVSLGLGMYGEHVVADWLFMFLEQYTALAAAFAHTIASVIAVAFLTYLHVVLGEMVAKSLALHFPETAVLQVATPMAALQRILSPLTYVLNNLGNRITRLLGIPPVDMQTRLFSPEELEFIVEESREGGLILSWEQLIIENILDLRERTVGQVMTPRTRMVAIPVDEGENQVLARVCRSKQSRFPVYEDNLDQIVGLLHVKDLARYLIGAEEPFDLRRLAQRHTVEFVPESLSLELMLVRFRTTQTQLAVVIDEFGGTAGIVTIEDVIEEIVGEIADELDDAPAEFELGEAGEVLFSGSVAIAELNERFGLDLPDADFNTVGGFVLGRLGRMAHAGDAVAIRGGRLRVLAVRKRRVERLALDVQPAAAS
jgi:CBS domain containing-hemolysin-like protein